MATLSINSIEAKKFYVYPVDRPPGALWDVAIEVGKARIYMSADEARQLYDDLDKVLADFHGRAAISGNGTVYRTLTPVPGEECEHCGKPTRDLVEVDDSDPAVGYQSTLLVCRECADSGAKKGGICNGR
jgi:hypothetical protein